MTTDPNQPGAQPEGTEDQEETVPATQTEVHPGAPGTPTPLNVNPEEFQGEPAQGVSGAEVDEQRERDAE